MKNEQKQIEITRKKEREEIEKYRDEEMLKIKKEKRVLEQRSKNLQISKYLPSTSSELENLKKKLKEANENIRFLQNENN